MDPCAWDLVLRVVPGVFQLLTGHSLMPAELGTSLKDVAARFLRINHLPNDAAALSPEA